MRPGWWRRGRLPAAQRSTWASGAAPASRSCALATDAAASERAVAESSHRGHLSVVTSDANAKARVAAERVRWLMAADSVATGGSATDEGSKRSRVLLLTGSGALAPDEASARAKLLEGEAFYALERQGHGIYSVRDFCRVMLEESGREQRVFGRAKLAAFLLHHRKELPLTRLHRGNATAPLQQFRHVSDLLQLFRVLEAHGVSPAALADDTRGRSDALSLEVAETYSVYHRLLAKHGVSTWDGAVLELLAHCEDAEFTASLLRGFTDIVIDDVQSLTPAMVQLVAKLCSHPSIRSSTSMSRVLDENQACPRSQQLEELLLRYSSIRPVASVTLVEGPIEGHRAELRQLSRRIWMSGKDPKRPVRETSSADATLHSDVLQCLEFPTVADEEQGIASDLRARLESGAISAKEIAVLAPTFQDAQRIADSFRAQGLPVRASDALGSSAALSVVGTGMSSASNLFNEPVVVTVVSLLAALCFPTDSRHLYNVLRSDFFAFPAELLSRLMEKEKRSHADLFSVLETFVATNGSSIYRAGEVDDAHELGSHRHGVEAGLATARAFVKLVKSLRAACHSQSAQEIVRSFLDETGRMESLLDPGSTEEEHEAIVLAEFLRELEGIQRVVQSDHVPLITPYLLQLREAHRSRSSWTPSRQPPASDASDDAGKDEAMRVLPLTMSSLESLAASDAVSVLVLMSMRDSKFPGRMRRVTLPLPFNLLSEPFPVQTRDEHIERCERLAAFALTIPRDQVVLSFAAVMAGPTSAAASSGRAALSSRLKVEQVSRVLRPIWQNPQDATPRSKGDGDDSLETPATYRAKSAAASTVIHDVASTTRHNPSHVSYTQISEYLRCPYRYYLARVMKLPGELSTAMIYGRVLHESIAEFASALVADGAIAPAHRQLAAEKKALSVFSAAWAASGDDALFSSPEHERALFEQGEAALEAFFEAHKRENPRVLYVEHPFSVFVPEADVELRGVWDRVDAVASASHGVEHKVIKEFKSNVSGAARDMAKQARDSLQLKLYMYAFARVFGRLPFGAALQVIGGDEASNAAGFVTASAASAQEAVDAVTAAVSAMRAGDFSPRPNYMECAFCPYASSACRAAGAAS